MNTAPVPSKVRNLKPWQAFSGVFVMVFLCVFGSSALITFLLPESFVGVARVRTNTAEQMESFQDAGTLSRVAEQLDLNRVFAQQYGESKALPMERTVDLLRRSLQVRRGRGTDLVEIRVYSHSPTEAARLANAIARTGIAKMTASTTNSTSGLPQIVDAAEPLLKPVRPNKPLNLTLGALVGIFLGLMAGGVGARLGVRRGDQSVQSNA